ncbi:hypothetical protein Hanom_Chr03g00189361 [Helianthus anomalus]
MNSITKLSPRPPLHCALAEPRIRKLTHTRGGSYLNPVTLVIKLVLNHLLQTVLIRSNHLFRRQQEVVITSVIFFFQFAPSRLLSRCKIINRHGCCKSEKICKY